MVAIDSVYTSVANPGASYTATTAATGDSLQIRNFPTGSKAHLCHAIRRGATAGSARLRSPRLHDNATGINWYSGEVCDLLTLPNYVEQDLYPADTLIAEVTGGAAENDALGFISFYESLPGADAKLFSPGDIIGNIKSLKLFQVALGGAMVANTWSDTVITTTENQLHANIDYAVLGYRTSVACAMIGLKAPETGNLRVCGPGAVNTLDTSDWFMRWAADSGRPTIPVFNANNRAAVFASSVDVGTPQPTITLVCAELARNLTGV